MVLPSLSERKPCHSPPAAHAMEGLLLQTTAAMLDSRSSCHSVPSRSVNETLQFYTYYGAELCGAARHYTLPHQYESHMQVPALDA